MANRSSRSSGRGSHSSRGGNQVSSRSISEASQLPYARISIVLIIFLIIAAGFVLRMGYLSLIAGPENAQKALDSRTINVDLNPKRGTIYDRNGTILATSVDATTVYCNPYEITDPSGTAAQLAALLGGSRDEYYEKLSMADTGFAYIMRQADAEAAKKVKDLSIHGLYFLADYKRVYPCNQTGGQVIGMVDVDGKGQSGLELYYDEVLAGTPGHLTAERGGGDYPIAGGLEIKDAAINGKDIMISLDIEMQDYVEQRLSQCVSDIQGEDGNCVLMDSSTGEIIACASTPYLNPSDRSNVEEGATELKSVSYPIEPGSIFKTATMMSILETDTMKPEDTLYCPSVLYADGYAITDAHSRADETMTLRSIYARSSNIGTSLAAEKMGFRPLYEKIEKYNLTSLTNVDFPGESNGYSSNQEDWSLVQSYNVTFGQGISVTPMQITRFYGAINNNGVECTPHFLMEYLQTGETPTYETQQVVENTNALPDMISMMQSVVEEGTGTAAQIEGFAPAGKTGTAEYADGEGKYVIGSYNISFVGFLPNTSSDLVCFVGVGKVPGDRITTPAFKDIMTYAIDRYRITPE